MPEPATPPLSTVPPVRVPDRWRYRPIARALIQALSQSASSLRARAAQFEPEEDIAAVQSIAEALVRRAMDGNAQAFARIADIIEGPVRRGSETTDEEADQDRARVTATIEGVVEAMTRAPAARS